MHNFSFCQIGPHLFNAFTIALTKNKVVSLQKRKGLIFENVLNPTFLFQTVIKRQ